MSHKNIVRTYPNYISTGFFTRQNLRDLAFANRALDLLCSRKEFAPAAFQVDEQWVPLKDNEYGLLIEQWMAKDSIGIRNNAEHRVEFSITTKFTASGGYNTLDFWVEAGYFESRERTNEFLQFNIGLYNLLKPVYGDIHQTIDILEMATYRDPRYGTTIRPVDLRKGLPGVYWANFFGPEYIGKITREKLLSAPCYRLQELSDGGILIVISPSPLAPNIESNRMAQVKLRNHLGNHFFYP